MFRFPTLITNHSLRGVLSVPRRSALVIIQVTWASTIVTIVLSTLSNGRAVSAIVPGIVICDLHCVSCLCGVLLIIVIIRAPVLYHFLKNLNTWCCRGVDPCGLWVLLEVATL
jgi:hypothetical protein